MQAFAAVGHAHDDALRHRSRAHLDERVLGGVATGVLHQFDDDALEPSLIGDGVGRLGAIEASIATEGCSACAAATARRTVEAKIYLGEGEVERAPLELRDGDQSRR